MPCNRPTKEELLEAVGEYLSERQDVASQYKDRVAANILKIVTRECELGSNAAQAEHARLGELLGADGDADSLRTRLCDAIRGGRAPNERALLDHLRRTALDKLAIDNPRYSSYLKYRDDRAD